MTYAIEPVHEPAAGAPSHYGAHHPAEHAGPEHAGPGYDGPGYAGPGYAGPGYDGPGYDGHGYAGPAYVVPEPNGFTRFFLRLHERSPRWAAPAAIAVCFAGVASLVWVTNPTDAGASDVSTCIVKMTTGLDCPGCGGTRAFYYLMHANVPEAARHHAMAVFAAPFLVWLYVAWAVKHVFGRSLPVPRVTARTISFFLAAWAVFMVARNLPFSPFTSLYV